MKLFSQYGMNEIALYAMIQAQTSIQERHPAAIIEMGKEDISIRYFQ
jgi:hypothetical protein